MRRFHPGLFLVLAWAAPAAAGDGEAMSPEVTRGHEIASTICWVCHVTGPDQTRTPALHEPGPDFRAIANRPDLTRDRLIAFLQTPHGSDGSASAMPNPRLTDEMIGAATDYILSLRAAR